MSYGGILSAAVERWVIVAVRLSRMGVVVVMRRIAEAIGCKMMVVLSVVWLGLGLKFDFEMGG